jgi:RNA polymerase sigma-70 factor, ECF subfamily
MDEFETHRPLLFSIAYRMLGSAMEAEDVVQEAYLRYSKLSPEHIQSSKAYLSRMVTNLCLDQLKSAKAQRETYIGPWLPEPILTTEDKPDDEKTETVSMAFLLLLEALSPVERAVFLLHEVFEYDYSEVAEIMGKDQAACRQLLHRARQHIAANRPRFKSDPDEHKLLFGRFMVAVREGDVNGLVSMLAEDATAWADGGGKSKASTRVVVGRERVAAFFHGLYQKRTSKMDYEAATVNASPGLIVREDGEIRYVFVFEMADGLIQTIRLVVNPDKLRYLMQQ